MVKESNDVDNMNVGLDYNKNKQTKVVLVSH